MAGEQLPLRVRSTARGMFAGAKQQGLSRPEIQELWSERANEAAPAYGMDESTKDYFDRFLTDFPMRGQIDILRELCNEDFPMYWGRPSRRSAQELLRQLRGEERSGPRSASMTLSVDEPAIQRTWDRALSRVESEPDGALTLARTLIEDVCRSIASVREIDVHGQASLPQLVSTVTKNLDFERISVPPDGELDRLMSHLRGLSSGIGEARNRAGDAHGRGSGTALPHPIYARFVVNLAGSVAGFLWAAHESSHDVRQQREAS